VILYFDTSSLVKLYVEEAGSDAHGIGVHEWPILRCAPRQPASRGV
jgi:predicted nucleic acid-binding protein